jgi:hypothetical protein
MRKTEIHVSVKNQLNRMNCLRILKIGSKHLTSSIQIHTAVLFNQLRKLIITFASPGIPLGLTQPYQVISPLYLDRQNSLKFRTSGV